MQEEVEQEVAKSMDKADSEASSHSRKEESTAPLHVRSANTPQTTDQCSLSPLSPQAHFNKSGCGLPLPHAGFELPATSRPALQEVTHDSLSSLDISPSSSIDWQHYDFSGKDKQEHEAKRAGHLPSKVLPERFDVNRHRLPKDDPLRLPSGFTPPSMKPTYVNELMLTPSIELEQAEALTEELALQLNRERHCSDGLETQSSRSSNCSIQLTSNKTSSLPSITERSLYIPIAAHRSLRELYDSQIEANSRLVRDNALLKLEGESRDLEIVRWEQLLYLRSIEAEIRNVESDEERVRDDMLLAYQRDESSRLQGELLTMCCDYENKLWDFEDAMLRQRDEFHQREEELLLELEAFREIVLIAEEREIMAEVRRQISDEGFAAQDAANEELTSRLRLYEARHESLSRCLNEELADAKRKAEEHWTGILDEDLKYLLEEVEKVYHLRSDLENNNKELDSKVNELELENAKLKDKIARLGPFFERVEDADRREEILQKSICEMENAVRQDRKAFESDTAEKKDTIAALNLQLSTLREIGLEQKLLDAEKALSKCQEDVLRSRADSHEWRQQAKKSSILERKVTSLLAQIVDLNSQLGETTTNNAEAESPLPVRTGLEQDTLLRWLARRFVIAVNLELQWGERPLEAAALVDKSADYGSVFAGASSLSVHDAILQTRDSGANPEIEERRLARVERLKDEYWKARVLREFVGRFDKGSTSEDQTQSSEVPDVSPKISDASASIFDGKSDRLKRKERQERKAMADKIQNILAIDRSQLVTKDFPLLDRIVMGGREIPDMLIQRIDGTVKLDWGDLGDVPGELMRLADKVDHPDTWYTRLWKRLLR